MKSIRELVKDMLHTYLVGARHRDKSVIGFLIIVVISITLIIFGLMKE